ncbi:MAG: Ig-like domain-containing protein [Spirochaetales bacterium]|jgi:hypothetical protein|nr:Ig-like domain-containing protein [Spirochaetales bacterium]
MKDTYAKMTFRLILISFLALILIGCGESGTPGGDSGPGVTAVISLSVSSAWESKIETGGEQLEQVCTPTDDGGERCVQQYTPVYETLASLPADGKSSATITITLSDSVGEPVNQGTSVTLHTNKGTFRNGQQTYKISLVETVEQEEGRQDSNLNGEKYQVKRSENSTKLITQLIAGTIPGTAEVWAESNNIRQKTEIEFTDVEKTVPAFITLGSSVNTVRTDNSDSSTITAVVLDADRAPVKGIAVKFTTTAGDGSAGAGQISASTQLTDENGAAEITFSAGVGDKRNQIVTIEATVEEVGTKQIPIQVTGSYLTVSAEGETNLQVGGETSKLNIAVYDAGNNPVFEAPVNLSLSTDSTGVVGIDPVSGQTDINGEFTVNIAGIINGTAAVQVEALGAMGLQSYTIDDPNKLFRIIEPTSDLVGLSTGEDLIVRVTSPGYDRVVFGTTIGGWDNGTSKVIEKSVVNGQATAVFSAVDAGTATIQAYPASNPTISDSIKIAISAPSSEAAKISFQSTSSVVAPSTPDVKNSVTLIAKITNSRNQIVKGGAVLFGIENPTGGGEYVSPAIAFSDESGIVTSMFTSGSLVAGADGVEVTAQLINNGASDSVSIVISGQAASVVIGRSTEIESINEGTSYQLPMSLLVTDANGSPVKQASVSLNLWPSQYSVGVWVPKLTLSNTECYPVYEETRNNEDVNKNLILDEGEDINQDGQLTPPLPAAGAIPDILVTDENGVANFYLVYLKSSAAWIKDEITATTVVSGTETASTYRLTLPWSVPDAEECLLPDSPYFIEVEEPEVASINITAGISSIVADGSATTTIRANVFGTDNEPMSGQDVVFTTTLGDFIGDATVETNDSGVAVITLKSETAPGTAVITANADGFTDQIEVIMTASAPDSLSLTAIPSPVVPNGQAVVVATIKDRFGNPVAGEQLNFQIEINRTGGSISSSTETSDVNGQAILIYTASDILGTDRIKVTLNSNQSISKTFDIVVRWANFAVGSISLEAENTTIPADGNSSTAITATIADTSGNPVPEGTTCVFTTNLGSFSNGDQVESHTTTASNGILITSLTAGTDVGIAVVTARCGGVTQAINIEIEESGGVIPAVGYITLTSNPAEMPIGGSSTITATVFDTAGSPMPVGTTIIFTTTLGTFPGGAVPTPPPSITSQVTLTTTDASGKIVTSLISPISPGIAVVQARSSETGGVSQSIEVIFTKEVVPAAEDLSISASKSSIKTNNADSTTISALVLDVNRVPIEGATVNFDIVDGIGGQLSASSAVADENGQASITLTSGPEKVNNTVTITAYTSETLTASLPVVLYGTEITLTPATTQLTVTVAPADPKTQPITVKVTDADGNPIYDAEIIIDYSTSVPYPLPGGTTLAIIPDPGAGVNPRTNLAGEISLVLTAGTVPVIVNVTASGLGVDPLIPQGTYTIGALADIFQISAPEEDPLTGDFEPFSRPADGGITSLGLVPVTIDAGGVDAGEWIVFKTSFGEWDNTTTAMLGTWDPPAPAGKTISYQLDSDDESVTLHLFSSLAGLATVQIYKESDPSVVDYVYISFFNPDTNACDIIIDASRTNILASTGTSQYSLVIKAKVVDSSGNPVYGATVDFSLSNTTGSGEYLSPVSGTTDYAGIVQTQFTSGAIGTGSDPTEAVLVTARVETPACYFPGDYHEDSVSIVISGAVANVSIGYSTAEESSEDDTLYLLPISVLVADTNGNPVPGAVVSLSLMPSRFRTGYWKNFYNYIFDTKVWFVVYSNPVNLYVPSDSPGGVKDYESPPFEATGIPYIFVNEDLNNNATLDVLDGEDDTDRYSVGYGPPTGWPYYFNGYALQGSFYDVGPDGTSGEVAGDELDDILHPGSYVPGLNDGMLTPGQSVAGAIPSSVTTDSEGVASFILTYQKEYAIWVEDQITATTMVYGTEYITKSRKWLPYTTKDYDGEVIQNAFPHSPFWDIGTKEATAP